LYTTNLRIHVMFKLIIYFFTIVLLPVPDA